MKTIGSTARQTMIRDEALGAASPSSGMTATESERFPARPYMLSDLITRCDLSAQSPKDMTDWDRMVPKGNEFW